MLRVFDAHLPSGDSLRHRRERGYSLHADAPRPRGTRQAVADTALRSSDPVISQNQRLVYTAYKKFISRVYNSQ